jgi:DASH complex subunit DAD1
MSTNRTSTANGTGNGSQKTYFDQQREMLVTEIAQVCLSSHALRL